MDDREANRPPSPVCAAKPHKWVNVHGEEWQDSYAWLSNREDPEVLEYIEDENKYSDALLADTTPIQAILYKEFVARLDESEESAHVVLPDGWEYYSKKVPGKEYLVHCRTKDGVEDIVLDENELAASTELAGASFFRVGFIKHSPDSKMVAYSLDLSGSERYTVRFLVLETKQTLPDIIEGVYEDFEFSNDGSCVYYTVLDDCERAYQFKRHHMGSDVATDPVLYHETDEMFYLALAKTCDGEYIILNAYAQITSETRFISANNPADELHLLFPRRENVQNTCEHHSGFFYVLTNENAKNKWLYRIPVPMRADRSSQPQQPTDDTQTLRETVIEHRDFVLIEDFQVRKNHLVVYERSNCLQNVRIIDMRVPGLSSYHYISFSEVVYSLLPGSLNSEVADMTKITQFNTNILRFTYTSFVQPKQVIDYDMDARTMTVVQEEKVPGLIPYDQTMYASRRLFATGTDGTAVPISIVYRRDLLGMSLTPQQTNPVLLHSYGAYGCPANPIFSSSRLSLLDRGFIYAIAHIRGGADMGNGWYEEGKLAKKPNTFNDFCSVAEYLIKEGYTEPAKLAIYGRSAGGLLIGAVVTMRPDLFAAALTEVPFVDVINTMFDATIPWTAFEYEEWGNPNNRDIYNVMKSYCPYTNVDGELLAKGVYPHLLVAGGMNDPRVAFFEPLKWVAKMRAKRREARQAVQQLAQAENTTYEERMLLLRIDDAGHGGNSGQYSHLGDLAFEYAFLIKTLGAPSKPYYGGTGYAGGTLQGFDGVLLPVSTLDGETGGRVRMPSLDRGTASRGYSYGAEKDRQPAKPPKDIRMRRSKEEEDKAYRVKTKGDRSPSRLSQWLNTWF
ncbi:prolyl oligopeptidase [Entophlyctis helioformis]|nr:prolyl oligopeptidase [Entophlyctis helioformis]